MTIKSILVVDDELEILDIIEILIESEFSYKIIKASSVLEAIDYLSTDSSIELIISDYTMPGKNGGELFIYNKNSRNLPFLLVSGGFIQDYYNMQDLMTVNHRNGFLQKPVDDEKLFDLIRNAFDNPEVATDEHYKKININYAQYLVNQNIDIYLCLSNDKYIKIINEGELQEVDQLKKYRDKGERYLYILSADFSRFTKILTESLVSHLENSKDSKNTISAAVYSLDFVHSSVLEMGLLDSHVELIDNVIENCLNNLNENNRFNLLLESFFKEEGYLVSHSVTSIYISYLICLHLDYAGEKVIEKLAYASIIHDLGLVDKSLSDVMSINDERFSSLNRRDQNLVLNHMFESAKLLDEVDAIPSDVKNLILDHHERPDGSGFPRHLTSTRISPVSAIFILSLELSHFLYFKDIKKDSDEFIQRMEKSFSKGNFTKPLAGLISSMKKALKS
ncbi:response regulator [Halobacteriovorax sp. HLS]|uniref:response regulator n=1 Tax=Halobacteriovorax sp. HLS TaxID=2234000 RepID=UPI000FD704D7|nr:response regulator [Halobacteriovorax sp. HLS]